MKLRSLFIADSVASEVSCIRAAAEAQAVHRGRIRVPAGATRMLIPFLVLCLMLGMAGCDLNLMGQTRFTVDGQVYGLEQTGEDNSIVTIGLGRVRVGDPADDPTQESDAEAISQVSGIVIVNPEGASVGVAEVTYDPYGGENGLVLISFETGGQSGPWTLMWPGYDPVLIIPEESEPPGN